MQIPNDVRRSINKKLFGNHDPHRDITRTRAFRNLPLHLRQDIVNRYERKTMLTTPPSTPPRNRSPPGAPKKSKKSKKPRGKSAGKGRKLNF